MRHAAPHYLGEGPHALWHVSEDDSIRRFEPQEGKVWAIDTRHWPLYWFPRECPRATFWADAETSDEDVDRFLGGDRGLRAHIVEPEWLPRLHTTRVVSYRMPEATFAQDGDRFWISSEAVEPLELVELGDLVARQEAAGIELRTESRLLAFWETVVESTLGFSGIRLRNARMSA
jgi:Family of unknown function (DUF6886)